jgi:hypothetical protein
LDSSSSGFGCTVLDISANRRVRGMTLRKIAKSMAKKTGENVEKIYKQLVNNKKIQRRMEADAFAENNQEEYDTFGSKPLDRNNRIY